MMAVSLRTRLGSFTAGAASFRIDRIFEGPSVASLAARVVARLDLYEIRRDLLGIVRRCEHGA